MQVKITAATYVDFDFVIFEISTDGKLISLSGNPILGKRKKKTAKEYCSSINDKDYFYWITVTFRSPQNEISTQAV